MRSVSRFTPTYVTAINRMHPWTSGSSRKLIDCMSSLPMPGHAKIVSVITAPVSTAPNWRPMSVTIGMLDQRAVEAQTPAQLVDVLLGCRLPEHGLCGIAGNEVNQRKYEGCHAKQHRDGQREATKQETQHSVDS